MKFYALLIIFVFAMYNSYSAPTDEDTHSSHSKAVASFADVSSSPVTGSQMMEVKRVAQSIFERTSAQDVILFLSPISYLIVEYERYLIADNKRSYFGANYSHKQPHTGSPWFDAMEEAQQRNNFEKHLSQIGALEALRTLQGNFIVVDVYCIGNESKIKRFYKTLDLILQGDARRALSKFQFYPLIDHSLPVRETISFLNEDILDSFCSARAYPIYINLEEVRSLDQQYQKIQGFYKRLASNKSVNYYTDYMPHYNEPQVWKKEQVTDANGLISHSPHRQGSQSIELTDSTTQKHSISKKLRFKFQMLIRRLKFKLTNAIPEYHLLAPDPSRVQY